MAGKHKELVIHKPEDSNLYLIKFAGGGQLPEELNGGYTSPAIAQQAIDGYYQRSRKPKKVEETKVNGES